MTHAFHAIGLTGGVETLSPANRAALEAAGIADITAVDVPAGASRLEMHEALREAARELSKSQPSLRVVVLKDSAAPIVGQQAFPDGCVTLGAKGRTLSIEDVSQAMEFAASLEVELPRAAAPQAPLPEPIRIIAPRVEPTGRAAKKAAKRVARIDEEKPTIVMVHPKPVDVRALNLSSGKAKLVHILLTPMEVPAEYLDAEGGFDSSLLGGIQSQKGPKPELFKWASNAMGLSFWKKFDSAAGSNAQLVDLLGQIKPDAVLVCGEIPRDLPISTAGIADALAAVKHDKAPKLVPYCGEIGAQALRTAVNDTARSLTGEQGRAA